MALDDAAKEPEQKYQLCAVCRVSGHGGRFCEALLRRPGWSTCPIEEWFKDDAQNQYYCPSGKRLVDFSDELDFSSVSMYLKGRRCLEDKISLGNLVPHLMPETFVIGPDRKWMNGREPVDKESDSMPWFVKDSRGNGGDYVKCCRRASDCMDLAELGKTYVVQPHFPDPMLYEGKKFHVKFWLLAVCLEDGQTWQVYTYKDGYLDIAPTQWVPEDISSDTQVVVLRSQKIGDWEHWPNVYPKCKSSATEVFRRGVQQGQLEGRFGKKQFEIISSDYGVDVHGNVWLFEFNMTPMLMDPGKGLNNEVNLYSDGRWATELNDAQKIKEALDIVFPWEEENRTPGGWDLAGEFVGRAPAREAAPSDPVSGLKAAPSAPEVCEVEFAADNLLDFLGEFNS